MRLSHRNQLLLHVGSSMTHIRNKIALRAVNPSFSLKSDNEVNYTTLPLDEFQNTLIQQTAARKATREATINKRQHRRFQNGNPNVFNSFSNGLVTIPALSTTTTDPVGGRLSKYYSNWTKISINSFVDTIIQYGYKIQFHTTPPTTTTPTSIHPLSQDQVPLINQTIQDLLDKQAIELVSQEEVQQTPGFYSSMFFIPKKDGGIRPVFNLKRLNQYLHHAPHFKMETLREVSLMIHRNDYLVSIDLSDAFLHIGPHPESRRFLRLKWNGQIYQYRTIAFGLASSPYIFTKVYRPILEHLRSQGIRISAYLDDWLLVADNKELALQQSQMVVSLLRQLGWLVNRKKSVLTPTQQLEHLGFVLHTRKMTAALPLKKLRDIRRPTKQVLDKPDRQRHRVIHSLTMRIQAATFAVFPARLYTRHLLYYKNQTVKTDTDWDTPRTLDPASLQELSWWYDNLKKWNGRSILPTTPTQTIFVGASNTGRGCSWNQHRAHDYWNPFEAEQSINWRELKAAFLALQTFRLPEHSTVLIQTDDTTSLSYMNKQGGNRSLALLDLATDVWNWCLQRKIVIQAQHIGGVNNRIADMESRRTFFKNQWSINPSVFQHITYLWGPFSVDLFAGRTTKLLPKYESWLPDPGAIHTNAFTIPWTMFHHPFLNPPWTPSGDLGGPVLAQCNVVPSPPTSSFDRSLAVASAVSTNNIATNSPCITSPKLDDALRMDIIRAKLERQNLNAQAIEDLLAVNV
ncbi:hypothetical protein [Parasitella parasitica]|uniref:Reverse transcriptase domain-containing protein n=1 Tax=Parasitella parasitica TaxID=35722 RepID=A0A0B7N194_9FUNG|nr:hypothetical protein [Parasitella parasitica]